MKFRLLAGALALYAGLAHGSAYLYKTPRDKSQPSFELGVSMAGQRRHYSGRHWRKELYEDAVATLRAAMS